MIPDIVYATPTLGVTIGINKIPAPNGISSLDKLKGMVDGQMKASPEYFSEIRNVNGTNFVISQFRSNANIGTLFNYLLFGFVNGQLLICSFNCSNKYETEWKNKGIESLNSIYIR